MNELKNAINWFENSICDEHSEECLDCKYNRIALQALREKLYFEMLSDIAYPFEAEIQTVENHTFWAIKSKALKGCVAQGDTLPEALAELVDNELEWIETAKECGIPIPEPLKEERREL